MLRKKRIRMNLQLLAANTGVDGGGNTGANADTTTIDTNENNESSDKQTETSFDDVLKNEHYKAAFDKKLQDAIADEKAKWETDKQKAVDDALTEADKLKKMSSDEKAKYQEQKRKEALDKREKDITTRELKAQARETLAEKNLPKELINALNFDSAETCNASIEAVEKAFQSAVQKAVEDRLKGTKPIKPTNTSDESVFGFNFTGVRPKENK